MPYFQRLFLSVLIVFVLLFSLCAVQPAKVAARQRCPVRISDSLLTLYLKSDAVVVATVADERFVKTVAEYDYGTTFEVEKTLLISETLKGRHTDSASFIDIAYKSKNPEENVETDAENPSNGGKALLFLVKNTEDNAYWLADSESGMRALSDVELGVYVKRLTELNRIIATRKNQLGKLTEWLVRLAEDTVTRGEGVRDLQDSFRALEYEQEEKDTESKTDKNSILLNEDFRAENASAIAEHLTDSQKRRLTNALLLTINDNVFRLNDAQNEEEITPDFMFVNLVGNWDKTFLAMTSFAHLQNAGDANRFKAIYLLDMITYLLEDDELYKISRDYQSALSQIEADTTESSDEEVSELEAISPKDETPIEVKNPAENESIEQVVERVTVAVERPQIIEMIEQPAAKISNKELRKEFFAKFVTQYGAVISQLPASK